MIPQVVAGIRIHHHFARGIGAARSGQIDRAREELAPYMGDERVNRYFDMFPAQTDWAGVAFYVKRNP